MTKVITTNINLEDNAKIIKSLDAKIAELKEVKEVMTEANVTELKVGAFTFTLIEITRINVDTKSLKTKYAELYKALIKASSYTIFEVA